MTDSQSAAPSCPICTEIYTKSTRKSIACNYCNNSACIKCHKIFILGSMKEAHCMSCSKEWSLDFIDENFTKAFGKELRTHKANLEYEKEKLYLPTALPLVEFIKKRTKINKSYIEVSNKILSIELEETKLEKSMKYRTEIIKKAKEIEEKYKGDRPKILKYISMIDIHKNTYPEDKLPLEKLNEIKKIRKRLEKLKKYINSQKKCWNKDIVEKHSTNVRPCPSNSCRGYLDVSESENNCKKNWSCKLCNTNVCKKCHVIVPKINEEESKSSHVCKEEDLENIKVIEKETRGCPKCGTRIFKISGCDQMWCTSCHTAFNWKSGLEEKGIIHNPHFFQYQKNAGAVRRNPLDLPCGGLPQIIVFPNSCNFPYDFNKPLQNAIHLSQFLPPEKNRVARFQYGRTTVYELNRSRYLLGQIDEKKWKSYIKRAMREYEIEMGRYDLVHMFVLTCTDIFQRLNNFIKILEGSQLTEALGSIQHELEQLKIYCIAQVKLLSKRYDIEDISYIIQTMNY